MATYAFTNASNVSETFTTSADTITLSGIGTSDFFILLDSNDNISVVGTGTYTNSTVDGGLGDDIVSGFGTSSLINGKQGNDTITSYNRNTRTV